MSSTTRKYKTYLILPLSLLLINVFEEIAHYKVINTIYDPHIKTIIMIFLYSIGFLIAANIITPWLKNFFISAQKSSKKEGGYVGIIIFYLIAFALIYWVYFIIYTEGAQYLLPKGWR